jgi:hypothetical protein
MGTILEKQRAEGRKLQETGRTVEIFIPGKNFPVVRHRPVKP